MDFPERSAGDEFTLVLGPETTRAAVAMAADPAAAQSVLVQQQQQQQSRPSPVQQLKHQH